MWRARRPSCSTRFIGSARPTEETAQPDSAALALTFLGSGAGPHGDRPRRRSGPAQGKGEEEAASLALAALDPNGTPVQGKDVSNDRQADAGPLGAPVGGGVYLVEALEDLVLLLRRDSDPRVPDLHVQRPVLPPCHAHPHPPSLAIELDGVGEQVDEDLGDFPSIGA